jgi:hypothetical protein
MQANVLFLLWLLRARGKRRCKFTLLRLSRRFFLRALTAAVRCLMPSSLLMEKDSTKGKNMGILWLVLFAVLWVALQAYILPKLGVST